MLLALLQANSAVLDPAANLASLEDAAAKAKSAGTELLVTPELFVLGYAPERIRAELDPGSLPRLRQALADIARTAGIGLVYSLPAVGPNGSLQITATLLDADGEVLLEYGKVHLFGADERKAFRPAEAPPAVVDYNGFKTSLLICYDVEFPEAVRAAATRGAELLLVPTALEAGFDAVPQLLVRARALESQLTVAYANHCGTEEGRTFLGGSIVASPDGSVLAAAGEPAELLFAEVHPDDAPKARDAVPYLRERRPGVYAGWGV